MNDYRYLPELVHESKRHIFTSLQTRFPSFELWIRYEDFHRRMSAGIVNPLTRKAVTITIIGPGKDRHQSLTEDEVQVALGYLLKNGESEEDLKL